MKDILDNISEPNIKNINITNNALKKITNAFTIEYLMKLNRLLLWSEGKKEFLTYQLQIRTYLTALNHYDIINISEQEALYDYFTNYKIN